MKTVPPLGTAMHTLSRGTLTVLLTLLCAGGVLTAPACSDGAPGASVDQVGVGSAEEAADDSAELVFPNDPGLASLESIPSQDEMDTLAADRISAANADEVFAQLKAELEADPDSR